MTHIEKLPTGACVRFSPASQSRGPAVLIVHGWGSDVFVSESYTLVVEMLNKLGYHTLQLSLRGHACSDGELEEVTRAQHADDIRAAYQYLRNRPEVGTASIAGVGVSYGGYLLAALSAELPLSALALRAPALYPDAGWEKPIHDAIRQDDLQAWRAKRHIPRESTALLGLHHFKGSVLIVASENDENMPSAVERSYRDCCHTGSVPQSTTYWLRGAGHTLTPDERSTYLNMLRRWFEGQ